MSKEASVRCIELMSEVIRMVSSAYCVILVGSCVPGAWNPLILVFDLISFASVSAIKQYKISGNLVAVPYVIVCSMSCNRCSSRWLLCWCSYFVWIVWKWARIQISVMSVWENYDQLNRRLFLWLTGKSGVLVSWVCDVLSPGWGIDCHRLIWLVPYMSGLRVGCDVMKVLACWAVFLWRVCLYRGGISVSSCLELVGIWLLVFVWSCIDFCLCRCNGRLW